MTDARRGKHEFHFRLRLFGKLSLEAFEIIDGAPGGYQFQILDQPSADPWLLMARLVERMRRALSQTHLRRQRGTLMICDNVLRGRITDDTTDFESGPVLVIDGKPLTWDRVGSLLSTFTGSQFKLLILDRSEELP
ncbi:DUF7713 domain-containing protein [Ahniella affigens]|nr:hypothetical protein [Ahniella affigens]